MSFPLTVGMQANLDNLEKDYDKAVDLTAKTVEKIEEKFKDSSPELSLDGFKSSLAGIAGAGALLAIVSLFTEATKQMAALADKAHEVAATTEEFQRWVYALRAGGAAADEAGAAIKAIGEKLNEARRSGGNDFTEMLEANGQKWKDQHGTIIDINTALAISQSLIRNAATELDKIDIGKHLGLSEEATKALDRMPGTFDQVAAKAQSAGAVIDRETIAKAKEFKAEWDASALQWETTFKRAVIGITGAIDVAIDKAKEFSNWLDDLARAENQWEADVVKKLFGVDTSGGGGLERIGAVVKQFEDASFTDRFAAGIKEVEPAAAAAAPAVEKMFAPFVAFFQSAGGDDAKKVEKLVNDVLKLATAPIITNPTRFPKGKDDDEDKKDTFDTTSDRLERRIKLYDAETASVGQNTFAKERAKAAAELLAAADRAERDVDDDLKKEIDELARKYALAAEAAAKAKEHYRAVNEAITYGGEEGIRILDGLRTKSITAQQAVTQLENSLITMLEKAALLGQGPLAGLLGTAAPTGTGGVGGLLGLIFGGARAGGGDVESGKSYLVGEEGPEILRMGGNGTVLPNRVISNIGGASQSNSFHVHLEAPSGSFDVAAAHAQTAIMRRAFHDMLTHHSLQQMRSGGVFSPNVG
jgi:hypothetical protein